MNIGLLIIGSEILEGKIAEANTRQLSLFLREHHLELLTTLTVKDQQDQIQQGLASLLSQCDVVLTSGGLGPTKDDLTKDAIASYLGRKVFYSSESHQVALKNYSRFNRPFPGKEHPYCFLPEGFIALDNSTGFAPTLFAEHHGKLIFCAPGVPKEFKSLLMDHFIKLVTKYKPLPGGFIESITARTKKIPEEKIFGEVDINLWDMLATMGSVSSLPTVMGVDIGVKIQAQTAQDLAEKKQKVLSIFENSPIKNSIWQIGNLSLEEYIVKLANQKNITYGFAESATGGMCSHRITNVSGSSQTFLGGIVSYAESVKENSLQVSAETLKTFGAVSTETAAQMSQGLASNLGVDIAISITGLAGPNGGTPDTPVGTVCFGVTYQGETQTHRAQFPGDREQLKLRFSQAALFYLLEELEKNA